MAIGHVTVSAAMQGAGSHRQATRSDRRHITVTVLLLIFANPLFAVSQSPPSCQIAPGSEESGEANAGCFVVVGERLLLVHEKYRGRFAIPGGTSIPGETAQCTAARETWEESGAEVIVGPRLHTFENGFRLFLCQWDGVPESISGRLPIPDWARDEVDDVQLLDPRTIEPEQYRFPAQLELIREFYESSLLKEAR